MLLSVDVPRGVDREAVLPAAVWAATPAAAQGLIVALVAGLAEVAALRDEVRALRAQVGQHSGTSSRPPSSDPPQAPRRPASAPSGRGRGGQPGHVAHQRAVVPPERVDRIVDHRPPACAHCAAPAATRRRSCSTAPGPSRADEAHGAPDGMQPVGCTSLTAGPLSEPEAGRDAVPADAERRECPLVLVSGAPATGKTTLATLLAHRLRLPLLAKDELKEALYDTLGAPDPEASRRLASPAYEILWTVLGRLVDAGVGAVVESNFYRGFSEPKLSPFVARTRAVLIHCHTERDNAVRRYAERFRRGGRHPAHFDGVQTERILANIDKGYFQPLDLPVPVLVVDTTAGYAPDLDTLFAFIEHATGVPALLPSGAANPHQGAAGARRP